MKTSFGFGSDGITNYFLKIASPVIASSLCKILSFHRDWGVSGYLEEARVAPAFKSGNAGDCSNYRPISVLTVVSRLFEKLIYNQLYKYLDSNKLLYSDQYGFRQLHSVLACLLKCTYDWYSNTHQG